MAQQEKVFAKGFYFKRREGAPTFVVGQVSIKTSEAIEFLLANQNEAGYVNLDVKQSQNDAYYMELNTYKPAGQMQQQAPVQSSEPAPYSDDLPF